MLCPGESSVLQDEGPRTRIQQGWGGHRPVFYHKQDPWPCADCTAVHVWKTANPGFTQACGMLFSLMCTNVGKPFPESPPTPRKKEEDDASMHMPVCPRVCL